MLITKMPTIHYVETSLRRGNVHNMKSSLNDTKVLFADANVEFIKDLQLARECYQKEAKLLTAAFELISLNPDYMLNPSSVAVARCKLQSVKFVSGLRANPQAYIDRGASHFTLKKVLNKWNEFPAQIRNNKVLQLSVKAKFKIKKSQFERLQKLNSSRTFRA